MKFEIFYSEDYNSFTLISENCKVVKSLLEDDAITIHSFEASNFESANPIYQKEIKAYQKIQSEKKKELELNESKHKKLGKKVSVKKNKGLDSPLF